MAYEKHTWQIGEIITADKLNHIEDALEGSGSGGGKLIVTITIGKNHQRTTDKTAGEIKQALIEGKTVIGEYDGAMFSYLLLITFDEQEKSPTEKVYYAMFNGNTFTASNENDYMINGQK